MKSCFLVLITIAISLCFSLNNARHVSCNTTMSFSSILKEICDKVADVTHKPELASICVSTLQVNASLTTDLKDLALTATNLMNANFTNIVSKINELLQIVKGDVGLIGALQMCFSEVKDAVDKLEAGYEAIEGDHYFKALYDLYESFKHFRICEGALSGYTHNREKLDTLLKEFSVADETSDIVIGLALLL